MIPTASPPRSKTEILADPNLNAWQRSQEITARVKWEMDHPQPPEPPTPLSLSERAELSRLKSALEKLSSDFDMLAEREKRFADELPVAQEKFHTLQNANQPNATRDAILAEIVEEKRLQKMQNFLANTLLARELMERQLIGHFGQLNHLLTRFNSQKFHVSGSRPGQTAQGAASFLEQFLKQ